MPMTNETHQPPPPPESNPSCYITSLGLHLSTPALLPGLTELQLIIYPPAATTNLLPLKLLLPNLKSHLEQLALLLKMACLKTRSHRSTGVTSSIHDVFPVMVLRDVKDRLDTRLREGPGTRIKRLLLAPHDSLSIRVAIEVLLNLLPREGVELLDTRDGGIGDALVEAVLVQRGVDLAGTEDHALDFLGRDGGAAVLGLGDDGAELGVADELVDGGAGERVAEEGLGEEDDEC
jgi:hypothetical protein